ncbi:Hypothetical protein MVR_LOCUS273 [uncultured virus]|nr:Hypothetical protein MVR_LOCUS273 [uncultured virus]
MVANLEHVSFGIARLHNAIDDWFVQAVIQRIQQLQSDERTHERNREQLNLGEQRLVMLDVSDPQEIIDVGTECVTHG